MGNYNNIVLSKRKPQLRSYRNYTQRYKKLEPHLVTLKLSYKKEFKVVQLKMFYKTTIRFRTYFKPIGLYFDVLIIPHKYLDDLNQTITSFKILGEEKQVRMAGRFLEDIWHTYYGAIEQKIKSTKLKRKQSRRLRRRWVIKSPLKDARYSTSRFKDLLDEYLIGSLYSSLESIKVQSPKAYKKGLLRTKRIKNYFYKKYGRKWKDQV